MFLDDTACNLASLNLLTFYDTKAGKFDVEAYRHAVRLWTLILEISVYMAQFPSVPVAQKSFDFRTLGLGYANLGALLMVQGIPYDSAEGRAQCGALTAIMHAGVVRHVGRDGRRARAVRRATRPTATHMLRVIRNHRRAAYNAAAGGVRGADRHARRHRRRGTARRTCSPRPAASPTACSNSARSTASATPRSR